MPTAMTFDSLQVDMRRYLERGSAVDTEVFEQLPSLINLAERAIARAVKIEGLKNIVTSTLVAGTSVYAKPDRWRETVSMVYGAGSTQNSRTPMFSRGYEYAREYWPNSSQQAPPEFYSDYDYAHWLIVPTPDISYPWEIVYYQQPPLLDSTNQTNWLTAYAPNTLLYRALLEATPFLKNDERIPVWQQMYTEGLQGLKGEDLQSIVDHAATRTGD